jgi:hypothetical protein
VIELELKWNPEKRLLEEPFSLAFLKRQSSKGFKINAR